MYKWHIFQIIAIPALLIAMGVGMAYIFGTILFSPQSTAEVYDANKGIVLAELLISVFAVFLGIHFYFTELPKLRKPK